jgi:hypothetical protein
LRKVSQDKAGNIDSNIGLVLNLYELKGEQMDTDKPPLYSWRDRLLTYALFAVILAAIAVLGSMVGAIASWLTNFLAQHPGII